jgi:hypothetical protein
MFGLAFLVACGLYAWLAFFVAKQVGKGTGSQLAKYITLVVVVLLPTWDILPGQLYHQHLCKTEGGVKVFKTIEVEKAYFLPDGRPDEKRIQEIVDWRYTLDRGYSTTFHITRTEGTLGDKKTGDRLGAATGFLHYGGWIEASILRLGAYAQCPQYPKGSEISILWREVIRPVSDAHERGK